MPPFRLQDSPDQGVLYLVKGLLNVLQNYPWETHADTKCLLFVNVLGMLSATSQEVFIHRIDKGEIGATPCVLEDRHNRGMFNYFSATFLACLCALNTDFPGSLKQ